MKAGRRNFLKASSYIMIHRMESEVWIGLLFKVTSDPVPVLTLCLSR